MPKNRFVNNTGATLPKAQKQLVDLLDQYLVDAKDLEDSAQYFGLPLKERLEDFIVYIAVLYELKLLDIDHRISVMPEEGKG